MSKGSSHKINVLELKKFISEARHNLLNPPRRVSARELRELILTESKDTSGGRYKVGDKTFDDLDAAKKAAEETSHEVIDADTEEVVDAKHVKELDTIKFGDGFSKAGEESKKNLGSIDAGKSRYHDGKIEELSFNALRQLVAEECGDAKKLGNFMDLDNANTSPDEAFAAGEHVGEMCPSCGQDMDPADSARASVTKDGPGRVMGSGGKARMSREHLYKISEYSDELYNMLADEDELPEWVQSKVAVMADKIGTVKHHLEYKLKGRDHG